VVAVLDVRTGAVVRILSPGIRLGTVAVSERLRRAYVLNAGDVEDGRGGSMAILDAMMGRLIRVVAVIAVAVDIEVDDFTGATRQSATADRAWTKGAVYTSTTTRVLRVRT
jgi:hypothetical protein